MPIITDEALEWAREAFAYWEVRGTLGCLRDVLEAEEGPREYVARWRRIAASFGVDFEALLSEIAKADPGGVAELLRLERLTDAEVEAELNPPPEPVDPEWLARQRAGIAEAKRRSAWPNPDSY